MLESAGIECFLVGENANNLLRSGFRARLQVQKRMRRRPGDTWRSGWCRAEDEEASGEADQARPRAVVCLSGGMDSCVCAALAARDL